MYSDENKSSAVAAILNRFDYVLIDTCSLMDPACPIWMDALHNAKDYRKKKQPIIVPRRCYDELKKHARDKSVDSKRIAAKRGLKILRRAKWDRLLAVAKKDKNENFADNAIYVQVCADRLFSKILIITQDKSLASDLLALNKLRSQQGRPVEVYKLVNDGKMVPNLGEANDDRREPRAQGHPKPVTSQQKPKPAQPTKGGLTPTEIQAADLRLCAVLSNPNYPEAKKKADAEAQLKAIESLPSFAKTKLNLKLDPDRLKEYLASGSLDPKPQPKQEPKPAPKKQEKPVPSPKKETAKKPAKPEEAAAERLYYGAGKTLKAAIEDCAAHYGIIFREPAVKYFPQAHGPFDFTTKDFDAILDAATKFISGGNKIAFTYKDIPMWVQKASEERFKYWIDVHFKAAAPVEEKPAPKPAKKTATKKEVAKPEAEKPTSKAKKVPKAEAKPAKAEPKAKKAEAKPAAVEKPVTPKSKATPKAKAASKETPKAEAKPKKTAKPKKAEPSAEDIKKAKDADRRLSAVVPNPNYALKDKVADMKAQRKLLAALEGADLGKLKYGVPEIDAWLKANENSQQEQGDKQ